MLPLVMERGTKRFSSACVTLLPNAVVSRGKPDQMFDWKNIFEMLSLAVKGKTELYFIVYVARMSECVVVRENEEIKDC